MGCWDETCGLTNTPIYAGEPCVMVILDHTEVAKRNKEFGGLRLDISCGNDHELDVVKDIFEGTYNDYGWLEEIDTEPYYTDKVGHIPQCLFFHKKVWDWAREQGSQKGIDYIEKNRNTWANIIDKSSFSFPSKVKEFYRVCQTARTLRRDICSGLGYQGHQEWCEDKTKRELLSLQEEILTKHEKMFEEKDS